MGLGFRVEGLGSCHKLRQFSGCVVHVHGALSACKALAGGLLEQDMVTTIVVWGLYWGRISSDSLQLAESMEPIQHAGAFHVFMDFGDRL